MEITVSKVTKIHIPKRYVKSMDAIDIFLESYEYGWGRITINWFDSSWSSHWCSTGKERVEDFVLSCDDHYLAKNLIPGNVTPSRQTQPDYEASANYLKEVVKNYCTKNYYDNWSKDVHLRKSLKCLSDCENEEEFTQWLKVQKDEGCDPLFTNPEDWLQIGDSEEMKTLKRTVLPPVRQALTAYRGIDPPDPSEGLCEACFSRVCVCKPCLRCGKRGDPNCYRSNGHAQVPCRAHYRAVSKHREDRLLHYLDGYSG